ncbi:MAG TPA: LarC family nickel insertion protein, partial [Pyrinomonadaceae bacterium]
GAPVYSTDVTGELVTPTGAAVVSTVCESFGPVPLMRVGATGYGAGTREYKNFPNVLRVIVGEVEGTEAAGSRGDDARADEALLMVETNVDDVSPQVLGHLMERALEAGALDCFFTHVQMKKNRPGVLVSILCRPEDGEALKGLLFDETPTLGVRSHEVSRRALERESVTVETEFGTIAVKVARRAGRVLGATPEFEECRAAALARGVPLRAVQEAARGAFMRIKD